jgi:hypothetical protein
MEILRSILSGGVLLLTCVPVSAQWLHYPMPGIPRTQDGKANLSAPPPKTSDGKPDLSGIWVGDNRHLPNLAVDGVEVPFQPWAAALWKERQARQGAGRPSEHCLTHGVTDFDALGTPRKIIQTPGVIVIIFEAYNHYRQILMDGRPLPAEATQPAYMGYSVGKWEGDTLVVDTSGFNDRGWLDDGGHPQTEALHVTERFRRRDFGHITLQVTIDDPKAYTKPWTVNMGLNFLPDEELIESICENEKDVQHMVGKQ